VGYTRGKPCATGARAEDNREEKVYRSIGCAALFAATVFAALAPAAAAAQPVASATVSGTVFDPSGAVVVGATVSIRNHDTNQVIETTTGARGDYRLLYIPSGQYHLSVAARGFAVANVNLELTVGQAVEIPVTVALPVAVEETTVAVTGPIVDTARTNVSATITPREVDTLPLNGRNYLDLALLAPNVSRTNTRSNERFAETSAVPGTGISIAGQRNMGNSFIVDGLSANDDAADLAGTYFSEEVIREFQVITSGGTAEFGRAAAGVINVVTHSGTNRPRGRVYGFFRDHRLDARNALATREDPLRHAQYGATYGGPLVTQQTFWFANVERTDQQRTGIVTVSPISAAAINAVLDSTGYRAPRTTTGEFPTGYETVNLFGRIDHYGTGGRFEGRYSLYDVSSRNARGVGGLNDVSRGTALENRDQTAAAGWLWMGLAAFNEARAQWTRSRLAAPPNDAIGPAVNVSGVASLGVSTSSPTGRDLDLFQVTDTVTFSRGRHLVKAGADLLTNRVAIEFPGALQGTYTFTTLGNLQRGLWQQYQQAFGEPSQSQSNPNLGLFVQDEWQPGEGTTVHAGVRYDLQWLPEPIRLDTNNIAPRIGIAWSPGGQHTVVRASAGIHFDRVPLRATSNALQRDGIKYKVAVLSFGQSGAPAFPAVLPAFPASLVTAVTTMDPDVQNGRTEQLSVQVEHGVGHAISLTGGYSYLRGHNILMSRNVNVPTLTAAEAAARGIANLGRPNPEFANISRYESIGDSWFHGLTLSLGTRTQGPIGARASYTLSTAEDTAGNAFFSSPQDNFDISAERGPSDNDQRHRLVVSGNVGGSAVRRLAGLQFGYVVSYATGVPFNVVAGSDLNNDTNNNDRPAGVRRNDRRQAVVSTVDLRVSRVFSIRGQRLEAMLDAFNMFNRVNILAVNNVFGTGATPSASFGQPTLAGDPRQIQLGVRWSF
jgi:hypothetical protein